MTWQLLDINIKKLLISVLLHFLCHLGIKDSPNFISGRLVHVMLFHRIHWGWLTVIPMKMQLYISVGTMSADPV